MKLYKGNIIFSGSQVGRVLGPDRGPDAGAGMTEFELHGVQPLPVKSQGLRTAPDWHHTWGRRTGDAQSMRNARESDGTSGLQISRIPEWPHGRNAPAHPSA